MLLATYVCESKGVGSCSHRFSSCVCRQGGFLLLCDIFVHGVSLIDHFTVACLVAWPSNESEAGGDIVLIETFLLFLC